MMTVLGFFWTAITTFFIGYAAGIATGWYQWHLDNRQRDKID